MKTVEANGSGLAELLRQCSVDELEPGTLDRTLVTAIRLNNMEHISALLMKGASIKIAVEAVDKDAEHADMYATLLLAKAAVTNDCELVRILHGEAKVFPAWIHSSVQKGNLPYSLPIQMAQQTRHAEVMAELLALTGVQGKSVDWAQFRLQGIEACVFERIDFVENLSLKENYIRTLPSMASLKQVRLTYTHTGMYLYLVFFFFLRNATLFCSWLKQSSSPTVLFLYQHHY